MANFWDNLGQQNNIDNNTMAQFQQFLNQMQNGGINNMQGQMAQIQQMMQMMNCKNPKDLVNILCQKNGINTSQINQMIKMVKNMSKK